MCILKEIEWNKYSIIIHTFEIVYNYIRLTVYKQAMICVGFYNKKCQKFFNNSNLSIFKTKAVLN